MCFMTKCPYVPPHEFDLDFPHLMLRYRAAEVRAGKTNFVARQLAEMDRNGRLAQPVSALANFATSRKNAPMRAAMEATIGIDAHAELPQFRTRTFTLADRGDPIRPNREAPAYATKPKAALFATCFVNYNKPETGMAARAVLNHIGVETRVAYPGCCGMPFLEQAELERVAESATKVSKELVKLVDEGYDIITLTASCGLMFKFEWPLIVPENADVKRLAAATYDIDEYVVMVAKKYGLPAGLRSLPEGVSVHLACHARAQNMGPKAAELLRLLPATPVDIIERCAGHGGTFGVLKETHGVAMKIGKPAMRTALNQARGHIASDCPLAAKHIVQGARELAGQAGNTLPARAPEHPIEIFARAYGLMEDQ
jgi:glycerol-3-phosphate dehydrogenase subunit C